ncbi:uncharacterized protein LOC119574859 [Penaeus monodon]|uniref:uncharacterized protein LOC119574859 n=1 Tax=Penaeus monodon TaxID=6687 RepID=UPI0018A7CE5C|nr:uncharacterized protein LOC119574859 [Penaeus monodon]
MGRSFNEVSIWIPDVPVFIDDFKLQKMEKSLSEVSIWIPDDFRLLKESVEMGKPLSEVSIWIPDIPIDGFKQRDDSAQRGASFNEVSIWIPHVSVPIDDFVPVDISREDVVIPSHDVWAERRLNGGCVTDVFVCNKGNEAQMCVFNLCDVKITIEDDCDFMGNFPLAWETLLLHYGVSQQPAMSQVRGPARSKRKRYIYKSRGLPARRTESDGTNFVKLDDSLLRSAELESVVWQ